MDPSAITTTRSSSLHDLSKDELIHIIMSMEAHHRTKTEVECHVENVEYNDQFMYEYNDGDDHRLAIDAIANADFSSRVDVTVTIYVLDENMSLSRTVYGISGRDKPQSLETLCCAKCESEIEGDVEIQIRDFIKSLPFSERFAWHCAEGEC